MEARKFYNKRTKEDFTTGSIQLMEEYLNKYANWKRDVNINVDSYPEVVLIEMFKETL